MGGCEFHDLLAKSQRRENLLQKSIDYADRISGNNYIIKQAKNSVSDTRLLRTKWKR